VRNRDPLFLLAAVLLHALAVGAVWTSASSARQSVEISASEPIDVLEFNLDSGPIKAPVIGIPAQPIARVTEVDARPEKLAYRANIVAASAPTVNDAPIVESAPTVAAPIPGSGAATTSEPLPADSLPPASVPGIDGRPIWAMPGVLPADPALGRANAAQPAPVVPAPISTIPKPVTAVLDYLASGNPPKPDARIAPPLHFPAAGTLASSLADEIRSSSTPPESSGIFELVIDAQGRLLSVLVVAADPKYRKEWDRVAQVVGQRFSGQTFPLPDAYVVGSRIRVAITSHVTMPDGTPHGVPMPAPTIPGLPGEHDIKNEVLDDPHRGGGGKAGLPPTQLSVGLKFNFDLANIGAKRRRVVRTRISAAPLARATSQGAADPRR
jgi:hypothetical protein